MELIIIEEGSVMRRLFVGSRMCGEYIMIICVGRVKGFMYMLRESERFNVYVIIMYLLYILFLVDSFRITLFFFMIVSFIF